MERREIKFAGPLWSVESENHPTVFQSPVSSLPGIYLWTVPYNDSELVYYVGETGRSFAVRTKEHFQAHLSGMYEIYDANEFSQGRKVLLWKGMWKRGTESMMAEFLKRHNELAPHIHGMLHLYRLYLAPCDCEKRLRLRIEAAIAASLYKQPGIVGQFQEPGISYCPRRADEEPVHVALDCDSDILGLPKYVIA
ncbi:MAG: hypothetical protein H7Y30_12035 [Pyrinomonadaceae bacterium]|nr:hypothetical protein [Pyrinomonadaceae bacterium]